MYGYPISRSSRCEWLLRELDVAYHFVNIDLINQKQHEPEFLILNPYGKVPVLVDRDVKIFESMDVFYDDRTRSSFMDNRKAYFYIPS